MLDFGSLTLKNISPHECILSPAITPFVAWARHVFEKFPPTHFLPFPLLGSRCRHANVEQSTGGFEQMQIHKWKCKSTKADTQMRSLRIVNGAVYYLGSGYTAHCWDATQPNTQYSLPWKQCNIDKKTMTKIPPNILWKQTKCCSLTDWKKLKSNKQNY